VFSYSVLLPDAAPDDVPVFEPLLLEPPSALLEPLSGLLAFDVLPAPSPEPFEPELVLGTLPRLSVT
jgi:hypothetical protein